MVNDVASASTALYQNNVAAEVNTSVLNSALDTAEVQGQALTDMMQSANPAAQVTAVSDPALGNNVDMLA